MKKKRKNIKATTLGKYLFKNQPKVLFKMFPDKTGKQILKIIKL